jgi:small-conductance mechanosensitive channel
MIRVVIFLIVAISLSIAQEENLSIKNSVLIEKIEEKIEAIESDLENELWIKRYSNYITYTKLLLELKKVEKKIRRAKRKKRNISELLEQKKILESQIALLKDYKESPFVELLKPKDVPKPPEVKNPIAIISALSYIKQINSTKRLYLNRLKEIKKTLALLKEKKSLIEEKYKLTKDKSLISQIGILKREIDDFSSALSTSKKTIGVYSKRVEEIVYKVTDDIKEQSEKAAQVLSAIIFLLIVSFIIKWAIRRYIKDSDRFYMANKAINFTYATLVILILLFAYIENVSYVVTILGFASAGIAIAMKDMFMSLLGWMVIVFGGSIHVGDRIKAKKEGQEFVGDVIDISLLRITILEDITLTSYMKNRRTGRVIFIPNNYIFTELIANYTHAGLKTVWDGIDINITYDSNHKKAAHIAREIARKYAKGYIEMTRKHINKLRSSYHLKNVGVDVRVYTFVENYGIRISTWYLTNSYATLTLRSTISVEILDAFNKEDDIKVTYPTQTLYVSTPEGIKGIEV